MKEAVGESTMTIITIMLVALALAGLTFIITNLLSNQNKRTKCENAGGFLKNGTCFDYNENECSIYNGEYNCG